MSKTVRDGAREEALDLAVVIVTYNSGHCVRNALEALRAHLPTAEIVVVDNGSTDGTVSEIAQFPHVRVVESGCNVGFARACNVGVAETNRSHVLFLNPDVTLFSVDRARLASLLRTRPFGLTALHLASPGEGLPEPQLFAERHWVFDLVQHTIGSLRPREWTSRPRAAKGTGKRWASGAALMVERSEFQRVGGFDPRFFLYYEDRELSGRFRDAGLPIRDSDALVGVHAAHGSSRMDELRLEPMAWSLLGWLEYVSLRNGEGLARRIARATLLTLAVFANGLRPFRRAHPGGRTARKSKQIERLLALVSEDDLRGTPAEGEDYFPNARRLLRLEDDKQPSEAAA